MVKEDEWETLPQPKTPVICNIHTPGFDSLNKFIPHVPKKKAVKKAKTDEEKNREFQTYWVKPSHMTKEEDEMAEDLLDYDPYSVLEDFGLQKAVPLTVKEIRQLDSKQQKNGLMPQPRS